MEAVDEAEDRAPQAEERVEEANKRIKELLLELKSCHIMQPREVSCNSKGNLQNAKKC